jgi:hypothetical protein
VHKTANILDALPKRLHRTAKAALHEIYLAKTRLDANAAFDDFAHQFGDKYPKAVDKLTRDRGVLLTFYDSPAAHWVHLQMVNPIESTFATVTAPHPVTIGAGRRRRGFGDGPQAAGDCPSPMAQGQEPRARALTRAGVEFKDGIQTERRIKDSRDVA